MEMLTATSDDFIKTIPFNPMLISLTFSSGINLDATTINLKKKEKL